jgi:hypothetical protein
MKMIMAEKYKQAEVMKRNAYEQVENKIPAVSRGK